MDPGLRAFLRPMFPPYSEHREGNALRCYNSVVSFVRSPRSILIKPSGEERKHSNVPSIWNTPIPFPFNRIHSVFYFHLLAYLEPEDAVGRLGKTCKELYYVIKQFFRFVMVRGICNADKIPPRGWSTDVILLLPSREFLRSLNLHQVQHLKQKARIDRETDEGVLCLTYTDPGSRNVISQTMTRHAMSARIYRAEHWIVNVTGTANVIIKNLGDVLFLRRLFTRNKLFPTNYITLVFKLNPLIVDAVFPEFMANEVPRFAGVVFKPIHFEAIITFPQVAERLGITLEMRKRIDNFNSVHQLSSGVSGASRLLLLAHCAFQEGYRHNFSFRDDTGVIVPVYKTPREARRIRDGLQMFGAMTASVT